MRADADSRDATPQRNRVKQQFPSSRWDYPAQDDVDIATDVHKLRPALISQQFQSLSQVSPGEDNGVSTWPPERTFLLNGSDQMKPSDDEHYRQLPALAITEASAGIVVGSMPRGGAVHNVNDNLKGFGRDTALTAENARRHGENDSMAAGFTPDASTAGFTFIATHWSSWDCADTIRRFGFERVEMGDSKTLGLAEGWKWMDGRLDLDGVAVK